VIPINLVKRHLFRFYLSDLSAFLGLSDITGRPVKKYTKNFVGAHSYLLRLLRYSVVQHSSRTFSTRAERTTHFGGRVGTYLITHTVPATSAHNIVSATRLLYYNNKSLFARAVTVFKII
jgi:hypothetical protein